MIGNVYIMINPTMPGYLKIGRTAGSPEERAKELSSSTGVAVPFMVAYYETVINCEQAESMMHSRLSPHRVNGRREFFHVSVQVAIREIIAIADTVGRPDQSVAQPVNPAAFFSPTESRGLLPIVSQTQPPLTEQSGPASLPSALLLGTSGKTPWGTVAGTASASIDIVLMGATRALTGDEILAEVRRLNLPVRAQAHPHLTTLKKRGLIESSGGKWYKTPRGAALVPNDHPR